MNALAAARAFDAAARVPFFIDGIEAGSVARAHLQALRAWPDALRVHADEGVHWLAADARDAVLARINAALREQGLIRAWRDETFAIVDPASGRPLARTERAAARFWGTLTLGAHATGFVRGAGGRPDRLWIAQRSFTKATDPGLYDNLVGGGVPLGQTPEETLVREAFEEAGLAPAQVAGALPGPVLELKRDIPEGLQHEWLYAFDLELPAGTEPRNQDGEVAGFTLMPAADALALTPRMTVDAAVVTLDFALRHGLLDDEQNFSIAPGIRALRHVRMW